MTDHIVDVNKKVAPSGWVAFDPVNRNYFDSTFSSHSEAGCLRLIHRGGYSPLKRIGAIEIKPVWLSERPVMSEEEAFIIATKLAMKELDRQKTRLEKELKDLGASYPELTMEQQARQDRGREDSIKAFTNLFMEFWYDTNGKDKNYETTFNY